MTFAEISDHEDAMTRRTAKLFTTGCSQAVQLPVDFHFEGNEVCICRDPETGDVILSERPTTRDGLFTLYEEGAVPEDFMRQEDRVQPDTDRDPFASWRE